MDDQRLRQAAQRLDQAVRVEGSHPHYHREQVERLKREWPTLWQAIEDVRRTV